MKQTCIFFILAFTTLHLSAQTLNPTSGGIGIGVTYFAGKSYLTDPVDYLVMGREGLFGSTQSGTFAQQAGITLHIPVFDRWHLRTGIVWSNPAFREDATITPGNGTFYENQTIQLQYLSVPLALQYRLLSVGILDLTIEQGITYDRRLGDELTASYTDLTLADDGWSGSTAIGISLPLQTSSSIAVKPTFQYALSSYGTRQLPEYMNSGSTFKMNSWGVQLDYTFYLH